MAEAQAANQRQLDEVLVRTQATPPAEVVTRFVYDGDGGRVLKQVDDWVTVYIGQHYVCQGTEHAVANGDPLACAKLIFANGQRVAMVQVDHPTSVAYFHQDHLGSSSVITDENGTVEQELAYYPFGETRVNTSTENVDVAYKFTGQEQDRSTGLYFYHARYYDPTLRRFIQPDTIVPEPFNPQALNRYSYVLNNPLKYTDPTGQTPNTLTLEQTIFDPILPPPQWLIAPCCTFNADISPVSETTLNLLLSPPPAQVLFPQLNNVGSSPLFEFNLFGQKIDVGVSASLVGVNVGNDLEGLSQSNFSLSVIAGISIGAGVDIRINPPSDDDFFVSPFVGFGKNLSIGTNLLKDPVTGADLGLQGLNISIGPSTGLPVGVQIPTIVNGGCKCN